MLGDYIETQPLAFQIMKNSVQKNRISHAYLIETNGFSQKKEFVFAFAKYLLCTSHHINYDGGCSICCHMEPVNLLDLKWIRADGMWIKKEQLEDVQRDFNKTSIDNNRKVYVIEDAEKLNSSSSNSILKFLEDPEKNIVAILMVDNIYQLLPTIVSRCQIIRLNQDKKTHDLQCFEHISDDFLETVYHFMEYVELYGKEALLYENGLWISHFTNKTEVEESLTVLLYLYKDLFNILVNRKIEKFFCYEKKLKQFVKNNTIESVCHKIDIIREKMEELKFNVNLNLLIDDLIIRFSEV